MKRSIRRIFVTLLILVIAIISTPTTIFADTETILKDKTNKLTLGDTLQESTKKIEEALAAGKSITYKIEIPKGVLYIELMDKTDYKVEIINSKDKVVKKLEAEEIVGGIGYSLYQVKNGVALSKGKYKIKISPKAKSNALNINGTVGMLKNSTSTTIEIDKDYDIAVTEGKTYEFIFKLKEEAYLGYGMNLKGYEDQFPTEPDAIVYNSKGKKISELAKTNFLNTLKKGTYTIKFKAKTSGVLSAKVYEGQDDNIDSWLNFNFDFSNK